MSITSSRLLPLCYWHHLLSGGCGMIFDHAGLGAQYPYTLISGIAYLTDPVLPVILKYRTLYIMF